MAVNLKRLLEIAKPRSKESIAKEQYWNEHKEEIYALQVETLKIKYINEKNKKHSDMKKDYFEKTWSDIIDETDPKIINIVNGVRNFFTKEKNYIGCSVMYILRRQNPNHIIFEISTGKNGCGNWTDYLSDISNAVLYLNDNIGETVIYEISNDVMDDIFTVTFSSIIK